MNILLVINQVHAWICVYVGKCFTFLVFHFLSVLFSARLQKRVNFSNNIEC